MTEEISKNILLVEDDAFVSDVYSTRLKNEGYVVEVALNGREAMSWMETHTPDLILLDIMMPYMDGIEVLEAMKKEERLAGVPVIMLTNLSEKDNIKKAMDLGAQDYLIKSHFTPSEIVTKVNLCFQVN